MRHNIPRLTEKDVLKQAYQKLSEEAEFRLRRFAMFIANALEKIYGRVSYIESLGEKV